MPRFKYSAIDTQGAEKTGELESTDSQQATVILRRQGLFPMTVVASGPANLPVASNDSTPRREGGLFAGFARINSRDLMVFTRQLGTLLHAGMPLLRSLEVMVRQERNPALRKVISSVAESIKSGVTLSDALGQHERVFSRLYISMIRAGEAGGVLDTVLSRLARFQEKSRQVQGKVVAALAYPLIVLAVAGGILAGLLVLVVPRFKQIFADLLKGAPLPPLTEGVLAISTTVQQHWLAVGSVLLLLGVSLRLFRGTAAGARVLDTLVVRAPLFGELVLKALIARFARTLGTLLASGVPILPALTITRDTCGNARITAAIATVHEKVKAGAPVARPLEETGVFPPMVASMIEVGEHSGQLPEMLNQMAGIYEDEVDNAVAGLSSLIEPILILFLAVVVGTIVIALFLPIIRIVQMLT
jgi:type IV pilus assembly protein PilC